MRNIVRTVLAVALATPLLAGCGRDPLVNGPFLIGAKRPDIRDGKCVPAEAIRSQDAHGDWIACPVERTYGRPITETHVAEAAVVDDSHTSPVPPAPRRRVPASPGQTGYGSDPRSAW